MSKTYQAVMPAPFGALGICVEHGELTDIDFLSASAATVAPVDDLARHICERLAAYLADAGASLDLPVAVAGTPFQQRVWRAIRAIPPGRTLTYTELAERVGSGARAVANACGANRIPLVIPCHRVVARHGLGGFMGGRGVDALTIKQWLLAHERSQSSPAG